MKLLPTLLTGSSLALAVAAAQAHALKSLADIEQALTDGRQVAVAIDLSQCSPEGSATASTTRGGLVIGSYRIVGDTLSFADSHFTVASGNQPIQQFIRYQVSADGSIAFSSSIFSVPGFALLSQVGYGCGIGKGVDFVVR